MLYCRVLGLAIALSAAPDSAWASGANGGGPEVATSASTFWSDYDNITARYLQPAANLGGAEHFLLNTRIPKKPFNKKNNFLSFETKNNNIEVGFEFSVPFLSVPVKRSVDSVRDTAQSVMTPLANINSGAIFLAGVMVLAGVTSAYIWRMLSSVNDPYERRFARQSTADGGADDDGSGGRFTQMLANLEELLQKYDIDASACGQRLVCSMVQNAAARVAHGVGTSADKLVDGLFGIERISKWMSGTPLERALKVARSDTERCERQYDRCRLRETSYELLSQDIFRFS